MYEASFKAENIVLNTCKILILLLSHAYLFREQGEGLSNFAQNI